MAALSIRNLDDRVHERLRVRAAEHGQSMEAEVRSILEEAVQDEEDDDLISAWMKLRDKIGGVELDIPPRTAMPRAIDFT
jgi:plasmid stability protein